MIDEKLALAVGDIAREGGALALEKFGTEVEKWEKSPNNFVCEVDLAVNELLRHRLTALLPDAGWLSEETVDNERRLAHDRVWVVDPIDGTRDYLRGRVGWAVSIALVDRARPVIAVLDAPARGEHWTAVAGQGAWRNGAALKAGDVTGLSGARTPADALPRADRDMVTVFKPTSIALRISMVAADEEDLLATIRWGNEWDIAAAALIACEAGGVVSDALGKPLRFNTPRGQAFGVLATAPGIHAAAVMRLRDRAVAALGKK